MRVPLDGDEAMVEHTRMLDGALAEQACDEWRGAALFLAVAVARLSEELDDFYDEA